MTANRKLQSDVERTLKKVAEGCEEFDQLEIKVQEAENTTLREKFLAELNREIKKLQRLRDKIKSWISGTELKDKGQLIENRKTIEQRMERFKSCEKETKMKAYSKEALSKAEIQKRKQYSTDPEVVKKKEWIQGALDRLEEQIEEKENTVEALKQKKKKADLDAADVVLKVINKHKRYVDDLMKLQDYLDDRKILPEDMEDLVEDVDYYIDSHDEPDFVENDSVFEEVWEKKEEREKKEEELLLSSQEEIDREEEEEDAENGKGEKKDDIDFGDLVNNSPVKPKATLTPEPISLTTLAPPTVTTKKEIKAEKPTTPTSSAALPEKPAPQIIPQVKEQPQAKVSKKNVAVTVPPIVIPEATVPPTVSYVDAAAATLASKQQTAPKQQTSAQQPAGKRAQTTSPVATSTPSASTSTSKSSSRSQSPALETSTTTSKNAQKEREKDEDSVVTRKDEESAVHSRPSTTSTPTPASVTTPTSAKGSAHVVESSPRDKQDISLETAMSKLKVGDNKSPAPLATSATTPTTATSQADLAAVFGETTSASPSPSPLLLQQGVPASQQYPTQVLSQFFGFSPDANSVKQYPTLTDDFLWTETPIEAVAQTSNFFEQYMLDTSFKSQPGPYDCEHPKFTPCMKNETTPTFPKVPLLCLNDPDVIANMHLDTLFFMFYLQPGTYQQALAAKELKRRKWSYHTHFQCWFQSSDAQIVQQDFETGSFIYFDYAEWVQRFKQNFTFEYKYLLQ